MTELLLGTEDGGREVSVQPGDRVLLRLPENPTTGYRWQGAFPAGLRVAGDRNLGGTGAPGAASVREFDLEPARPGRFEIDLVRARAWEAPSGADERFRVVLRVD